MYSSKTYGLVEFQSHPAFITLRPNVFALAEPDESAQAATEEISVSPNIRARFKQCIPGGFTQRETVPIFIARTAGLGRQQLQGGKAVQCSQTEAVHTPDDRSIAQTSLQIPGGRCEDFGTG